MVSGKSTSHANLSDGYRQLMLWTNDILAEARGIYERVGFRLTEQENHRSFGHDLVGQNWELELEGN